NTQGTKTIIGMTTWLAITIAKVASTAHQKPGCGFAGARTMRGKAWSRSPGPGETAPGVVTRCESTSIGSDSGTISDERRLTCSSGRSSKRGSDAMLPPGDSLEVLAPQ